ncbi:MAG: type II toxin-antitoxin system RelE family toxin [Gammaproteobacteria bacterium]
MYEILLASQAERDLKRLAAQEFHRIILAIKALAETPRPPGCRKLVSSRNDYRIRIGDYRVIYEVDDKDNKVRIMRIRHRRDIYR